MAGVSIQYDRDAGGRRREAVAVDGGVSPATAAEECVRSEYPGTVEAVVRAADTVADRWDGEYAADRGDVVDPMAAELASDGTDAELVTTLESAVEAAGYELRGDPVPAPPYLAVTGRGPILRGTVADGRLVVEFRVFGVDRTGDGPRYVRTGSDPDEVVAAEFRGDGSGSDRP